MHQDASHLRELLRDALAARLEPSGWRPIASHCDRQLRLAAFVRPVGDDFAASVEIAVAFRVPDRERVRLSQPRFGVSYEPLRRLWPLLTEDPPVATRLYQPGSPWPQAAECLQDIGSPHDAMVAADRLAQLAADVAVPFAAGNASLEAVLRVHRSGTQFDRTLPALLGAARQFDAARDALSHYSSIANPAESTRARRRYVYQLNRWLNSGGDPALLPNRPPPKQYHPAPDEPPSSYIRSARALHHAVQAVREASPSADSAQLRTLLQAQLASRGLRGEPLWIEQRVDELLRSPSEPQRGGREALRLLGQVGRVIARGLRDRELPALPHTNIPASAEPPARAVYAMPQNKVFGHEWTAVPLDTDASRWLCQVHADLPHQMLASRTKMLEVWFDWAPRARRRELAVNIGPRCVGHLDAHCAIGYVTAMEAAAKRAELPCATARLTRLARARGYLLELAIPAPLPPPISSANRRHS